MAMRETRSERDSASSMTKIIEHDPVRIVVIEPEADQKCQLCGAMEETRPYGPDFKRVCHACAMKDKEGTERRMGRVLFGDLL